VKCLVFPTFSSNFFTKQFSSSHRRLLPKVKGVIVSDKF
jgi:hypothetical protein